MEKIINFVARLRLNTKLLLGFGGGFLITLLVGVVSLFTIYGLSETAKRTYEHDLLGIARLQEAEVNLVSMSRSLRDMALSYHGERPGHRTEGAERRASGGEARDCRKPQTRFP